MSVTDDEWHFVATIATAHAKDLLRELRRDFDPREIDGGDLASRVFDLTLPDVDETLYAYMTAADVSDVSYECAHIALSNAIITNERYA